MIFGRWVPLATDASSRGGPPAAPRPTVMIFGKEAGMSELHWAIRLRKRLLIRGTHRWNAWVRDVTARMERAA